LMWKFIVKFVHVAKVGIKHQSINQSVTSI